MKSLLSLFLCLCLLCSAVLTLSSCEKRKFDFELNEDGSGYTVIGYRGDKTIVEIPEKYKSKPVTAIGKEAFAENTTMEKVIVPDGVKEIGFKAFYACSSLVVAELPEGLNKISSGAFEKCTSLREVRIPEGVTTVIDGAFMGCSSLTSVSLPSTLSSVSGLAFIDCTALSEFTVSKDNKTFKVLDGSLVNNEGKLISGAAKSKVTVSGSVTKIGVGAFSGKNIVSIVLPTSITFVDQLAFANCQRLASVFYLGTESEYSGIEIGDINAPLEKATVYFYSESEPTTNGNFWHYVDGKATVWH